MIFCEKCFQENRDGTVFCEHCGTSLLSGGAIAAAVASPGAPPAHSKGRRTFPQIPRTDVTPATPPRIQGQLAVNAATQTSGPGTTLRRIRLRLTNGKAFELAGKSSYLIGRYDAAADTIPDVDLSEWNGAASGVSRRHALLHVEPDGVYIEDLESLNETIRNNFRLLPHQRYPLADGDELRLGSISLLIVLS